MTTERRVLGIDLASRSWQDNGSAILTFAPGRVARWLQVECSAIQWPTHELSPGAMAQVVEEVVAERGVSAVSLDGPQGWRDPNAGDRPGVGKACEYDAHCQGKTGEVGKTFPQTQHGWIKFCIDVFAELWARLNAQPVNDPDCRSVPPLDQGQYWLLECFPTSTWRASRLAKLPGKSRIGRNRDLIAAYARSLQQWYGLPGLDPWEGSHDDLQAIVAALPAAGLLGGPCHAMSNGKARIQVPPHGGVHPHWAEGIIWDGTPAEEVLSRYVELPAPLTTQSTRRKKSDRENPLLIDDRDDGGEQLLDRGVRLFKHLLDLANNGNAVGVGYAQFVADLHGVERFRDVANRRYAQADTNYVLSLAEQVTEAAGGPQPVSRDGASIDLGMDAFVWRMRPPHPRPARAFRDCPYSEQEWKTIFPDERRSLLSGGLPCDINSIERMPARTSTHPRRAAM